MDTVATGRFLNVLITEEGEESWPEAEQQVPPNKKACKVQLRARIQRLADFGRLRNPDLMNSEGDGLHAIKTTCGLRAYGWFGSDENSRKVFIIAYVIMKKSQKAKPADLEKVKKIRKRHGEKNDG